MSSDAASLISVGEFLTVRPNLEVADLDPTVRQLCDVLGFHIDVEEKEMGLVLLHRDAVGLAVVKGSKPGVNETTACYMEVNGVDDLYAKCVANGANVVSPLTDHPWGLRDFVVELPSGHRLAMGERIS
jgi:predicted enzyme related to lactoylglutathione lyase